jgi:hypothetical protein
MRREESEMSADLKCLFHPLVLFIIQVEPVDENSSAYRAGAWTARIFIAFFIIVAIYTVYRNVKGRKK